MAFRGVKLKGSDRELKKNVVENLNLNPNLKQSLINGFIGPLDAIYEETERINTELKKMLAKVAINVAEKNENKMEQKKLEKNENELNRRMIDAIGEEKIEIEKNILVTHDYYIARVNEYKRLLQEEEENNIMLKTLQEKKKMLENIGGIYNQKKSLERVEKLRWGFDEETSTEPTNQHMIFFRQIKRNDDM